MSAPDFPLSRSQEIIWLHEELFPGSRAYNFTASIDLTGELDAAALHASLAALLDRHEGLRLELVPGTFPPRQRVNASCTPRFRSLDLSARHEPDADLAYQRLWRDQHDERFDGTAAPMVRWTLIRLGPDRHRLLHTEHHLVHDGHSFALLLRDLFTLYRARTRGTPADLPPTRSYAEHATQSAAWSSDSADDTRRRDLEFWRGALAGALFDLPLPGSADAARVRETPVGGQLRARLAPELAERLRTAARRDGHTPFSILLALYAELLRRLSGRADLVIGSAVGNRPPGFEQTVGMFVNTIALRIRLDPAASALEAADEATDVLVRSLTHQEVPIQDLARHLGVHSQAGLDNPLFRVMFSAHDAPIPTVDPLDLAVSVHEGYNTGTSRFDLDVVLIPDDRRTVNPCDEPGGMLLIWDYASDLFDEPAIAALNARLVRMLEDYLADPATPLRDLASSAGAVPVSEDQARPIAASQVRSAG